MIPMKRRKTVSTNDTIIGEVRGGSFRFPIQFEMFGENQSIEGAVYDTGCSHSLISASSLFLGNKKAQAGIVCHADVPGL